MSITSKIFAATGIAATATAAFAMFALGATTQSASPSRTSITVLADNPWGKAPALAGNHSLNPLSGMSTTGPDDNPWG